ncbi:MFS transporter [Streptosporangium lutulentum]
MFATGLAVFATASAVAALAPGFAVLVGARFAQGVGAALTAPAAMAVLRAVLPDPDRYARAMATWGGLSVLGATAGTLLSGVVTTWVSWRWMFGLALLVSVVALPLTPRWLPAAAPTGPAALDLPGAALATAGVTLFSYGLLATDGHSWASATVLVPLVTGLALLAAFAAVELRGRDPLLPPAFLADRRRAVALPAIALSAAGTTTVSSFSRCTSSRSAAGRRCGPRWPSCPTRSRFSSPVGSPSRFIARFGARTVVGAGLAVAAGGLFLLSGLDPRTEYVTGLLPGIVLLPAGVASVFAGAAVLAVAGVPRRQAGLAGGVMNTAMELGPTVGLALLMTVAAARTSHVTAGARARRPPRPAVTPGRWAPPGSPSRSWR